MLLDDAHAAARAETQAKFGLLAYVSHEVRTRSRAYLAWRA